MKDPSKFMDSAESMTVEWKQSIVQIDESIETVVLVGPGKNFEKTIEDVKLHKLDLNDRQKKAMEYLQKKGNISRKEFCELTGVSLRQVNKDLTDLLAKKVIVQVGMGRSTKYRVHD